MRETHSLPPLSKEELLQLSYVPGAALLFSGGELDSSQKSILGLCPYETIKNLSWEEFEQKIEVQKDGDPYPEWIGMLGYEMGATSDPQKKITAHDATTPKLLFHRYGLVVVVDHQSNCTTLITAPGYSLDDWCKIQKKKPSKTSLKLISNGEDKEVYIEKIQTIRELIRDGEVYQVNLSQQFLFEGECDSAEVFIKLAEDNPAPFSAYLDFDDFSIISSSPERLIQKKGNLLESRPIKGTMTRGNSPEEDLKNRDALLSSPKEKSELLMITDLMRNDLGKVSQMGSVKVTDLYRCEEYSNVFHMLSVLKSKALPNLHPVSILRACFPGGSITGCPKLSAMELIAKIENRPRGIYTGSIGYFTPNGDMDFNVAIRTLTYQNSLLNVQLGGAIVIDSEPEKEFEETLHKGQTIFQVLR